MPSYRCYFIDRHEHVAGPPELIETDALAEAIDQALAMLEARPHYRAVEVWDGGKRLYPPTTTEHTCAFLRMAAVELRRLADQGPWPPEDAARLRHIADQCDQEANALARAQPAQG